MLDTPPNFPRRPNNKPNSPRAMPIAVRPRVISSQDIEPNFLRPSANLSNACTAISKPKIPVKDFILPTFPRIAITATNSPRATPIAVRPRVISSQDIEPNLTRASAIFLQLSANAIIAMLVLRDTLVLPIILRPNANSTSAPPSPTRPLIISSNVKADIFIKASAKISTALATSINAIPDFIIPPELNVLSVFVIFFSIVLSIPSITPIPANDLVRFGTLILDNF